MRGIGSAREERDAGVLQPPHASLLDPTAAGLLPELFPIERRQVRHQERQRETDWSLEQVALDDCSLVEPAMNSEWMKDVECVRDRRDIARWYGLDLVLGPLDH